MQNNDFHKLNGLIAKLTQAATKGMKRDNSFKKMTPQSTAEMKENTRALTGFENRLAHLKGMD